jgi:hypothetical protein
MEIMVKEMWSVLIAISTSNSIEDVYHVQGLGYNLLSVSQLCEKCYNCLFTLEGVTVSRREHSSILFAGHLGGKVYYGFHKSEGGPLGILSSKSDLVLLWHHRLAHVGMRNLAKLQKDEHILGLTNVVFENDRWCSACQAGKPVGAHHPSRTS